MFIPNVRAAPKCDRCARVGLPCAVGWAPWSKPPVGAGGGSKCWFCTRIKRPCKWHDVDRTLRPPSLSEPFADTPADSLFIPWRGPHQGEPRWYNPEDRKRDIREYFDADPDPWPTVENVADFAARYRTAVPFALSADGTSWAVVPHPSSKLEVPGEPLTAGQVLRRLRRAEPEGAGTPSSPIDVVATSDAEEPAGEEEEAVELAEVEETLEAVRARLDRHSESPSRVVDCN